MVERVFSRVLLPRLIRDAFSCYVSVVQWLVSAGGSSIASEDLWFRSCRRLGRTAQMPFLPTVIHDVLQIVTVALGSPLGREVAPRELSAVLATWLSERAPLTPQDRRIMIACGAGAGLAAVCGGRSDRNRGRGPARQ